MTGDSKFDRDKFFIDVKENYAIYDEGDVELFFVDVPWQKRGREITLYDDEELQHAVLLMRKDDYGGGDLSYKVEESDGTLIASLSRFRLPVVRSPFGDRWEIKNQDGQIIGQAREGPPVQCLLKWALGLFFFVELLRGLVKTNFRFVVPDSQGGEGEVGFLIRRGKSGDDHVLDLSAGPERELEPRIALAAALVFSKGERQASG